MARFIDADALMQLIRLVASRTSLGETKPNEISGIEVIGLINDAPTVDAVEVVHGKWERTQFVGKSGFYNLRDVICSECKTVCSFLYDKNTPMNYCPNCGAKMDGERKESE